MKLENQVCSLELAKKLKEFGVTQNSFWFWCDILNTEKGWSWQLLARGGQGREYYSAFTVAELGEMLPWHATQRNVFVGQLMSWKNPNDHAVVYGSMKDIFHRENADTEADARAKMLVYLMGNELIAN